MTYYNFCHPAKVRNKEVVATGYKLVVFYCSLLLVFETLNKRILFSLYVCIYIYTPKIPSYQATE